MLFPDSDIHDASKDGCLSHLLVLPVATDWRILTQRVGSAKALIGHCKNLAFTYYAEPIFEQASRFVRCLCVLGAHLKDTGQDPHRSIANHSFEMPYGQMAPPPTIVDVKFYCKKT